MFDHVLGGTWSPGLWYGTFSPIVDRGSSNIAGPKDITVRRNLALHFGALQWVFIGRTIHVRAETAPMPPESE